VRVEEKMNFKITKWNLISIIPLIILGLVILLNLITGVNPSKSIDFNYYYSNIIFVISFIMILGGFLLSIINLSRAYIKKISKKIFPWILFLINSLIILFGIYVITRAPA